MNDQILIGIGVAVLCAAGLWQVPRLLGQSRFGRAMVGWFGEARAPWVLRGLLLAGVTFGLLLATDVIRPVRW